MTKPTIQTQPIEPPSDVPEMQRGDWLIRPETDPVVRHLTESHCLPPTPPSAWEAARLSHTVYAYRETTTRWSTVAKFYAAKTGHSAHRHAQREFEYTQRARFYRATSTLRIARNGWLSRLDRTALVAQAMALLADVI